MSARLPRWRPVAEPAALVGDLLHAAGQATALGTATLRSLLTQRPTWGAEAAVQASVVIRAVMAPVLAVNAIFALSIIGLALGVPLEQLGASDRNAAFLGPGLIREFGVVMTGAVLSAVVGTAHTAEFGARRIRGEIEALEVLGIDVVRAMVVPRLIAIWLMAPVVFLLGIVVGTLGTYVATTVYFGAPGAPFLPQLLANTSWIDLWAAIAKLELFGLLIVAISCAKGLNAEAGARGVGRAVNESVVSCLVAVLFVNVVYTQLLLGIAPDLTVFR